MSSKRPHSERALPHYSRFNIKGSILYIQHVHNGVRSEFLDWTTSTCMATSFYAYPHAVNTDSHRIISIIDV